MQHQPKPCWRACRLSNKGCQFNCSFLPWHDIGISVLCLCVLYYVHRLFCYRMLIVSAKMKFHLCFLLGFCRHPHCSLFNCFSSQMRIPLKTGSTSCWALPDNSAFLSEACTGAAHDEHLPLLMEANSLFLLLAPSPPSLSVESTQGGNGWCWLPFLSLPKESLSCCGDSFIYLNVLIENRAVSGSMPCMGKIMVIKTDSVLTLLKLVF